MFQGGTTYDSSVDTPGGDIAIADFTVQVDKFRDFSSLSMYISLKPETFEIYRSSSDGGIRCQPMGHPSNVYTITISPHGSSGQEGLAGDTASNIGAGTGYAEFTGLGGTGATGVGTGNTTMKEQSDRDVKTTTYDLKVEWRDPDGSKVTFDNHEFGIGQSGYSYSLGTNSYPATYQTDASFMQDNTHVQPLWSGSSTGRATWSDAFVVYTTYGDYERV